MASNELDSLFEAYAKKAEADAKASANHGSFVPKTYEEVKYSGLETGKPSVFRAVGGPPDSKVDNTTAKTVTIARIIGDDGKKFRVILPSFEDNPNYILNKIISRVKQVKYVNKEKVFPVKDQYPEIYNIIDKNGLQKNDPKFLYDKGWTGKKVIIMNVIDRAQMDWHRENKHTMLLAKGITESNGIEYVDEGVSSFAIKPKFVQLMKYYGSWEKYDIAITKTGDMNNAFIVENATKNPERVEGPVSDLISMETALTPEEASWERYDISKLFRITTATKIYNKLKTTIARIDTVLHTNFLAELEAEVEKEKALFDELYGKESEDAEDTPITEAIDTPVEEPEVAPAPVAAPRARVSTTTAKPGSNLPYYDTLSDDLKDKIKSAVQKADGTWEVEWDLPVDMLASCPTCRAVSPLATPTCPICGITFA